MEISLKYTLETPETMHRRFQLVEIPVSMNGLSLFIRPSHQQIPKSPNHLGRAENKRPAGGVND